MTFLANFVIFATLLALTVARDSPSPADGDEGPHAIPIAVNYEQKPTRDELQAVIKYFANNPEQVKEEIQNAYGDGNYPKPPKEYVEYLYNFATTYKDEIKHYPKPATSSCSAEYLKLAKQWQEAWREYNTVFEQWKSENLPRPVDSNDGVDGSGSGSGYGYGPGYGFGEFVWKDKSDGEMKP